MVHAAAGYARMRNRLGALVCTTSIGPGATNMVTGAALATINRLPVLLVPGRRVRVEAAGPGAAAARGSVGRRRLRQRLVPRRSLATWIASGVPSRSSLRHCRRCACSTSPAETGRGDAGVPAGRADRGVRLSRGVLPQARVARPASAAGRRRRWREAVDVDSRGAASAHRRGRRLDLLRGDRGAARLREQTGIPVGETQAGKGSLPYDHPSSLGAIGATGTSRQTASPPKRTS